MIILGKGYYLLIQKRMYLRTCFYFGKCVCINSNSAAGTESSLNETRRNSGSTLTKTCYKSNKQKARSKTRKPRKSRKFFSELFKSEFPILAIGQN